jgi:ABC-type uncharacterized transport system substrate-binding protein
VVSGGDPEIRAAKNATTTIPIVMVGVGTDPVKAGFVESLAHPGGNVSINKCENDNSKYGDQDFLIHGFFLITVVCCFLT